MIKHSLDVMTSLNCKILEQSFKTKDELGLLLLFFFNLQQFYNKVLFK